MPKKRGKSLRYKIGIFLLIVSALFFLMMVSVTISTYITKARFNDKYPQITIHDLEKGDIIFGKSVFKSGPLPGYWSHSAIFYGWINGTPMVVESYPAHPIRYTSIYKFAEKRAHLMVGRISNLSDTNRQKIVDYAYSKIGLPFDYWYPNKQLNGTSYYCSELVWDSYLSGAGIDLDINPGFFIRYANAVAPQEIFDNPLLEKYNLKTK